jgi:hypothetical protein
MWREFVGSVRSFLLTRITPRAEREALRCFRIDFPHHQESWSMLVSRERDRFVVCVFYGPCSPAQYKFYSVSRDYEFVRLLRDDRGYRPKGWC